MDLTDHCIFCGSTDNLNTSLTVKIDNQRHAVSVCDNCEDQAAPKAVKKLVEKHLAEMNKEQEEIEKLKELASKHGLILVPDKAEIAELNLDSPSKPTSDEVETKPKAIVQKAKPTSAPSTNKVIAS